MSKTTDTNTNTGTNTGTGTTGKTGNKKNNIGGIASGIIGGLSAGLTEGINTAQIDTSSADNALAAINNLSLSTSSLRSMANDYNNNLAKTDYTSDDFAISTKDALGNMAKAGLAGASAGTTVAPGLGTLIGAGIGMAGAGIGWGINALQAKGKADEYNTANTIAEIGNLNTLTSASETLLKQQRDLEMGNIAAYGGPLFNHSGDWSNGLVFINEGGRHEDNPLGGVPVGMDSNFTPNLVEEGEIIWNDYVFSNRLKPTKKQLENLGYKNKYNDWTFAKIVEDVQKISAETPVDKISTDTLNDNLMQLVAMQEEIRMKKEANKNKFKYGGSKGNILKGTGNFPNFVEVVEEEVGPEESDALIESFWGAAKTPEQRLAVMELDPTNAYQKPKQSNKLPWQSNLRYASPLLHGINLLNNLKKPSYADEESLIEKSNKITRDSHRKLTNTLDLDLIDPNVLITPIIGQGAANRRAIQQNANVGNAANASLLANNYLINNAIGNALIQGIQANNAIKSQEAQFDMSRDSANMSAELQGLGLNQQADQLALSTLANAIQQKNAKDAMRSTAIGSESGKLATDLASMGNEAIDRARFDNMLKLGIIHPGYTDILATRDNKASTRKNGGLLTRNRRRK